MASTWLRTGVLVLAGLAGGSARLAAQACWGVPTADGQFALGGGVSLTDGATSYGFQAAADFNGPFSLGLGVGLTEYDNVEPRGNNVGVGAAFELPARAASICPTAGFAYSRVEQTENGMTGEATLKIMSLGVGVGRSFPVGSSLMVGLYGVPQFLYMNVGASFTGSGGFGFSASDSRNEFGADLGLRIGTHRVFGGASVSLNTLENSDPMFSFGFGFIIGN